LTTVLEKLKALDAQRAQLLDDAKKEALQNAEKAVAELLGVFATLFMVIIAGTARQIEQFEQYKAEIRKKWGDHVISNSEKSLVSAAVMLQPDDEIGHANGE
jgi:hypothetical protein